MPIAVVSARGFQSKWSTQTTRWKSSNPSCRSTTRGPTRSPARSAIFRAMPSPGDAELIKLTAPQLASAPQRMRRGSDLLQVAREQERTGCIEQALVSYETVIQQSERRGNLHVLAEALRRLAILQQQRDETNTARALCVRSYNVARACANDTLAAEALNSLGGIDLTAGALKDAREAFIGALWIGGASPELRARVEQNLGILANIQGDLDEALKRYGLALDVYRSLNDQHGCAIVYHNLGMVNADRGCYDDAE